MSTSQSRPGQSPAKKMSGGEFIIVLAIIASVLTAAYFIYNNPATNHSAIWVAIWGVMAGSAFIGDARLRSASATGSASVLESLLIALIWGLASAAVIFLGGGALSVGWTALISFAGAGVAGRGILQIK